MSVIAGRAADFATGSANSPKVAEPGDKLSWLARAATFMLEARTRQIERQVARMIESQGGRFNDALERRIQHEVR